MRLVTSSMTCGRFNSSHFSARGAGGRVEPVVKRSGTPGICRKRAPSPRSGRQLLVIRHFIIAGLMAVARFADWRNKLRSYLGFRAVALHPRLYAAARIRGLRTRQNAGNGKHINGGSD